MHLVISFFAFFKTSIEMGIDIFPIRIWPWIGFIYKKGPFLNNNPIIILESIQLDKNQKKKFSIFPDGSLNVHIY